MQQLRLEEIRPILPSRIVDNFHLQTIRRGAMSVKVPKSNNFLNFIQTRSEKHTLSNPDPEKTKKHDRVWDFLLNYYFRFEMFGWENLPPSPSMLVSVHSGTWLTMDAWALCAHWWRKFQSERILHGTAHDVLMSLPILGEYFSNMGVIPAKSASISSAFDVGHDVVIWPGGELDAMRSWSKRGKVVLGNRKGFIRLAIRSGVPIVPVATYGGHNTVIVLSECRKIAKILRCKKYLRSEILPLVLGFPFGIAFEVLPIHIPLPAKIRSQILAPITVDTDPEKANDNNYVDRIYKEIEGSLQDGVDELQRFRRPK